MEQLNFNIEDKFEKIFSTEDTTVEKKSNSIPLAARLRPDSFDEYIGQKHLLSEGNLLKRAIDADRFTSIILCGPPGVGKTSLAELIAKRSDSAFIRLSGVVSSVSDIRREIAAAVLRKSSSNKNTILFIDEIHRFNKAQQDVLLPDIESGNIRLVGATTHNPHFYVIGPLLSRSLVFHLEPLTVEDIKLLLRRAVESEKAFPAKNITISDEAVDFLATVCEGDARKSLNSLEIAVLTTPENEDNSVHIDLAIAEASIQKKSITYGDDGHYDTASAFIKSMRGSDPDAALYWLAKMLHAGEDIRFIARRITIFASEDIGNADPRALSLATNAMQAVEMIGMPEAKIILSQVVTYCATAPKSNAAVSAINSAMTDIKNQRVVPVPKHLKDAHYKGGRDEGNGKDYKYPHSYDNNFVAQDYLGVEKKYYFPVNSGYETRINERIDFWNSQREKVKEKQ